MLKVLWWDEQNRNSVELGFSTKSIILFTTRVCPLIATPAVFDCYVILLDNHACS